MSGVAEANEEAELAEAASRPADSRNRWEVFSHRNFTIFWLSLIGTNTGTWMAGVAEGWLITDLEPARKSFYLGLIAISFAVPMMLLPPFGGVVADRLPKITGLKITQAAFLVVNSATAALALTGRLTVPVLVVAAALGATILAFDSPIRHSIVPDLVPRSLLTSAVSVNAVAFTGAGLIGPAIGGLLIPLIGTGGVFLVNAISSLSVLIALRFITDLPNVSRSHGGAGGDNPGSALGRAFRHMRESPLLFGLFVLALIAGFFGRSYAPMLPVMSRDVYEVGSTANGILISAGGLGAMAGGIGLSAFSHDLTRRGRLVVGLVVLQALLLVVLAITDLYLLGILALVLMGACGAGAVALITALVQEFVAPEYRGRVMGYFLLTIISFPSAGSFLLGLVADQTTIQWGFAVFAAIVVVGTIVTMMRNPAITAIE